jgi:hypothetical protein
LVLNARDEPADAAIDRLSAVMARLPTPLITRFMLSTERFGAPDWVAAGRSETDHSVAWPLRAEISCGQRWWPWTSTRIATARG